MESHFIIRAQKVKMIKIMKIDRKLQSDMNVARRDTLGPTVFEKNREIQR